MGKNAKDTSYRRWDCDDETEEQLALEDHQYDYDHESEMPTSTTTFTQPSVTLTGSHNIQRKRKHQRVRIKDKVQIACVSFFTILFAFGIGYQIGVQDLSRKSALNNSATPSKPEIPKFVYDEGAVENDVPTQSQESFDPPVAQPPKDINTENIREVLKKMSGTSHGAGTPEGKSMAMAIRDQFVSYGLSVRVESHKSLLTKVTGTSYAELLDRNGSVIFRTPEPGDHLNARPMIAFSPAADINGTLIYCHYGRPQDFDLVRSSRIVLNRSIALIRFGGPHPSKVAAVASAYGIKGLIFYPDPSDYGPNLPSNVLRSSSLLTLGQIHEYQKHKSKSIIPAHTITPNSAEQLFRSVQEETWMKRAPTEWQGGLKTTYFLGPSPSPIKVAGTNGAQIHLRIFNEPTSSEIFNVVGSLSGALESDRYIIIGCSHDSWGSGVGEPGFGIALLSELARTFSSAVQRGWKPRRSILFISWDASLFAASGVSHWLQEHHYEISSRTIAYIDLSRALRGNRTLHVHSSPILKAVVRKAIAATLREDSAKQSNPPEAGEGRKSRKKKTPIYFSSLVTSDEPSFAFLGNLGIPFIRLCLSNSPEGYDYPLFHSSDTYENFLNSVDPNMEGAKTLGQIILETIVLLADAELLLMNVEDYVVDIQKAFGDFIEQYSDDLHKAHNLSIAYLQAAVMRLEVIGDNFRTEMQNRTVINPEYDTLPAPSPSPRTIKSKKALIHRIINDKLMEMDRTFLSRGSDVYKHQVLGFSSNMEEISITGSANTSSSYTHYFPKLKEALDCGRRALHLEEQERRIRKMRDGGYSRSRGKRIRLGENDIFSSEASTALLDDSICHDWRSVAAQRIASLTRALDAASAVLQSPLLPEEGLD